jgi:autotransporter-associated beta strand protein
VPSKAPDVHPRLHVHPGLRRQHGILKPLLITGLLASGAFGQNLSNILGVAHINGSYYLTNQDYPDEGANQIAAVGSGVIKLEMDQATLSKTWSVNSKYAWNTPGWPAFNGSTSLTSLAQTTYFSSVFNNPALSTYVITAYSPNIPSGGDGTEYWLHGMTASQKAAETASFYNLTKYLMQTYAGTGKSFYLEQWEGDWALKDPNRNTQPTPTAVQGMIDWFNARQAGIDEARAQFTATSNVKVFGTVEVNRVQDAMQGDVFNGQTGWATVTNDVLPFTNTDFASYSSYDTQQNITGTFSYANAVQYLADHLPASAANGQNTHSVYVGEYGLAEDSAGITKVNAMMNNVISTVKTDGMPLALYWEVYSNELSNGVTVPPGNSGPGGSDSSVKGFYLVKPDGTPATAWHQYRYQIVTSDPTQVNSAAVQGGLHLAYASNFTAPSATLGTAWITNTSANAMTVGISNGQLQMTTANPANTPVGQATLNLNSILGRGLKPGEYLQFTLNRQNDAGIIGLSAFGLNHGSGTAAGNQPLNVFSQGGWKYISFNPTGTTASPSLSYNWDAANTSLGLRLDSADGNFATLSYYINGVYGGSWLYPTTSKTLDTFSLFAQSNTANAGFGFNNLAIYTTNGNLAATSYKWDPAKTGGGNSGGTGTWDAAATKNFYTGSTDVTWANATLGDTTVFGGTVGTVTINSAGVTASNLVFNTPGYILSGGPITMMGNQTITNDTVGVAGNVTITSPLAGTAGLTIAGAGKVILAGANTFTGGLYVSSGSTATFTADNNLGAAGQGVILNGSTLSYAGNTFTGSLTETARVFTIGAQGGTFDLPPSSAGNAKLIINGTGLIGGSGNITKTGPGWLTLYGDNGNTFAGNWIVNGGVLEAGGQTVLGAGSVTVNNGSELAVNLAGGSLANPVTVNTGAILGTDNHIANSGTYSGPITANGNFNVRLGDFYSSFSEKVSITGNITGAGKLTTLGPNGTNTTNPASQILTLTGDNSGFSGGIAIPLGTVAAGLSKTNTLGTGPITLSGGKLALQGELTPTGTAAAVAATAVSGFNADTIFGNPDMSSFSTPTTGADGTFSFFQTGYTPQFNPTTTILNAGTKLTGGLPGQNITSAINNTPFSLQPFMADNTLQIKQGSTGTLTVATPAAFTTLSVLAASTQAADETPNLTIHFTDGSSVTTTYKSYDWSIGTDPLRQAASAFGATGIDRYSPSTSPGWDTGSFGMYETDINLTNINGVDYSNQPIASLTFTATTHDTLNRGLTDIYAVSGAARAWATGTNQSYTNNLTVIANSGIDVSGSLDAAMDTLNIGANKLSITSADATSSPYSLSFGATTLAGNATFDVAPSASNGPGTLALGPVSGTGSITKTNTGTLQLTANSAITGALALNGGTIEIDAPTTVGSWTGNGTATLNVPGGSLAIAPRLTGNPSATALASLSITNGGKLDLANNDLLIHNGNLSAITALIKTGFNGGKWNGSGIASSTAAADHSFLTTLGTATGLNSFDGNTVSPTDVLVKYTYYGDADLSGKVDGTDYSLIDHGFNTPGATGWINGDFNYDGKIDGSDYSLIDNAFNLQGTLLAAPTNSIPTTEIAPAAPVPEPTALGLIGMVAIGLLNRRHRKRLPDHSIPPRENTHAA